MHDEKMEVNDASHYQKISLEKLWNRLSDDFCLLMQKVKTISLNPIISSRTLMVASWHNMFISIITDYHGKILS